jgi:hypothetical protein
LRRTLVQQDTMEPIQQVQLRKQSELLKSL